MSTMRDLLSQWVDAEVNVINPQSYVVTALKDSLTMETYQAKVTEVGDDFVRLRFHAVRRKEDMPVDQLIPLNEVKRVSTWGEDKYLHL
jgi:hypothetical protein